MKNETKKKNIILPLIIIILGVGLLIFGAFNYFTGSKSNDKDFSEKKSKHSGNEVLLEDVTVTGYMGIGDDYTFYVTKDEEEKEYKLDYGSRDIFVALNDYSENVKVDIYYVEEKENRVITKYVIYSRETNEDISDVKTVPELRTKLGLYNEGTYTEDLTLSDDVPLISFGSDEEGNNYTSYEYIFLKEDGSVLSLMYVVYEGEELPSDLFVKDQKYSVTFEVTEGVFDYEYKITNISKK